VSRYVNSPDNEGPECIRPADAGASGAGDTGESQGTLL
jgi:hypothetical protein